MIHNQNNTLMLQQSKVIPVTLRVRQCWGNVAQVGFHINVSACSFSYSNLDHQKDRFLILWFLHPVRIEAHHSFVNPRSPARPLTLQMPLGPNSHSSRLSAPANCKLLMSPPTSILKINSPHSLSTSIPVPEAPST